VRIVLKRRALGQGFSEYFSFVVSIIPPTLHIHCYPHVAVTKWNLATSSAVWKWRCIPYRNSFTRFSNI
jgi:hypothetical protein